MSHTTARTSVLLVALFGVGCSQPQQASKLEWVRSADGERDARRAVKEGDFHLKAIKGFTVTKPGVPDGCQVPKDWPVRVISGTSDMHVSSAHTELIERARKYVERFNRAILKAAGPENCGAELLINVRYDGNRIGLPRRVSWLGGEIRFESELPCKESGCPSVSVSAGFENPESIQSPHLLYHCSSTTTGGEFDRLYMGEWAGLRLTPGESKQLACGQGVILEIKRLQKQE